MGFWSAFWTTADKVAAVIAILGLPYLVASNRRRVARFSFEFSASNRQVYRNGANEFCKFSFTGSIRNQSLDPNSIQHVYLVVWQDRKRKSTQRFGFGATVTENGSGLVEPIRFDGREGKHLEIAFEIPLTGTGEERLVKTMTPASPGSSFYLPAFDYELAFEDIGGNLFDQKGILRSRKGIDLRWTIGNTLDDLKGGNPLPFASHLFRIYASDVVFSARRSIRRLGI
jgi:hypothetical protein